MRELVLDVETTISNKGNPFDQTNKLCYVGIKGERISDLFDIEYSVYPYVPELEKIQLLIDQSDTLIGFNIKFDLHWIRRYGINFSNKRIWDCQLVHFILTGQTESYPSLNGVAAHYGLGIKLDVVSTEYWKNGIDTPNVPKETLEEYLQGDLDLTYQVYLKQLEEIQAGSLQLQRLVSLHNQDLLVLEEMEFNGLIWDDNKSEVLANEIDTEIKQLDERLFEFHSCSDFNLSSVHHISALLYGGSIRTRSREACGTFKSGAKAGQPKERWVEKEIPFPRIIKPIKGSELATQGLYSTDEQTLRSLKGTTKALELVEYLLKRAELEKKVTTYYRGLIKLSEECNWTKGKIHGQLNQCVARTGRLSSSKPNLQNFDGGIKGLFYSRFT